MPNNNSHLQTPQACFLTMSRLYLVSALALFFVVAVAQQNAPLRKVLLKAPSPCLHQLTRFGFFSKLCTNK
jgi:hypothetical protein